MTHSLEQTPDLRQQKDSCIRDVLFATQRNVSPNLLLVNCYLRLWVETSKSQTTGGSVTSAHVQIPLGFSRWPYHCALLCPSWSCVSGPRPAELTPHPGLAMLLSVNSIIACHPRNVLWLTWNHQEADQILAPGKYFRVNESGSANSPCCPVAQGGCMYRMWLAQFNFCLCHRKLREDRGKPRIPLTCSVK